MDSRDYCGGTPGGHWGDAEDGFHRTEADPSVGAEINGLDLRRPLDPDTVAKVRKVWLDNVVVVFPQQALDDEQQIAFSRQVGELEMIKHGRPAVARRPEIFAATNLDENDEIMAPDHPVDAGE